MPNYTDDTTLSDFWRDAIDPEKGGKIICEYPSGSTVRFTETARKLTENFDRLTTENAKLRGELRRAVTRAVETIHAWHGDGPEWEIYLRHSPEMKDITASLTPEEINEFVAPLPEQA